MAVLAPSAVEALRRRAPALAATFAGVALIGCGSLTFFGTPEPVVAFPHKVHVVDEGLDCIICHYTEEGDAYPLPPDPGQCSLCHDGMDEEKPEHLRASAFFVQAPGDDPDALVLRPGTPRYSSEVIFDHSGHAALLGDDCLACHAGIDESDRIRPTDAVTMSDCTSCHEEQGHDNSCATCHREIDRDWAPPSHAIAWSFLHGDASRAVEPLSGMDCALCHSQSSCTECHRSTPPASHDEHFRLRGHGVLAELSRDGCSTCHTSDSCTSCHETARPLSHHGAFGSPVNQHCTGCHFPLTAGDGCATCHRSAPSHATAAPQPPGHVPGANCRLCHAPGALAPLPHVDDGSACALCHR